MKRPKHGLTIVNAREAASENLADHDPGHANKTRWFLAALQEWTEQDDRTYQTQLKAGDSLSAADHYRVNWDFVLHDPLIDRTPLAQRSASLVTQSPMRPLKR